MTHNSFLCFKKNSIARLHHCYIYSTIESFINETGAIPFDKDKGRYPISCVAEITFRPGSTMYIGISVSHVDKSSDILQQVDPRTVEAHVEEEDNGYWFTTFASLEEGEGFYVLTRKEYNSFLENHIKK